MLSELIESALYEGRESKAMKHAKRVVQEVRLGSSGSMWTDARIWEKDGEVRIYPNSRYRTAGRRGFSEWKVTGNYITVADDGKLKGKGSKNAQSWMRLADERRKELQDKIDLLKGMTPDQYRKHMHSLLDGKLPVEDVEEYANENIRTAKQAQMKLDDAMKGL